MGELGETLRLEREARNLSLEQAARSTRIKAQYLLALEEEQYSRIPGIAYARGFLRSYARFLGLPVEETVERFNRVHPLSSARNEVVRRGVSAGSPRLVLSPQLLAIAATILLVLASATYLVRQIEAFKVAGQPASPGPSESVGRFPSPAVAAAVVPRPSILPSPLPSPSPTPSPAVLDGDVIIDQQTWCQILVDGDLQHQNVYPAGTSIHFRGSAKVRVWAGAAGRVRVTINGVDLGSLGDNGESVAREYTLVAGRPSAGPKFVPASG